MPDGLIVAKLMRRLSLQILKSRPIDADRR